MTSADPAQFSLEERLDRIHDLSRSEGWREVTGGPAVEPLLVAYLAALARYMRLRSRDDDDYHRVVAEHRLEDAAGRLEAELGLR